MHEDQIRPKQVKTANLFSHFFILFRYEAPDFCKCQGSTMYVAISTMPFIVGLEVLNVQSHSGP